MPSTSVKQHRFMQAVAHSPSFAKKAGVSQSVGKDFSAADKGKTFNKGGMMKKGKRFNGDDGESGVEYHEYDPDKTYSGRFTDDETGGLAENTPTRSTAKAAPAAPAPSRARPTAKRADLNNAIASHTADKEDNEGRNKKAAEDAALTKRVDESIARAKAPRPPSNFRYRPANSPPLSGTRTGPSSRNFGNNLATKTSNEARTKREENYGQKKGGAIMESKSMKFAMGGGMPSPGGARPDPRMMAAMRAQQAARQQPMRRPPPGGMPPPAQPPMGMKKGGAAKYAKGGGIESRGKTKGTIIRMAAGGSVSSRADGIAQRGKTRA
jgi:hypothetical protein